MTNANPGSSGAAAPGGRRQDLILGLVITGLGLALWLVIIPLQVDDSGAFGLPPSLAPRALSWVMIACGVVLTLQNLRSGRGPSSLTGRDIVYLAASVGTVAAMVWLMMRVGGAVGRPFAGFLVAAPLGLIALTLLHSRAPLWAYAFNAIAAPAVIYAAFWWGLRLPLP